MLLLQDELLGFGREPHPLGTWGTMAQLAISANTLEGALRRLARFYRLVPWGIESSVEVHDDELLFCLRPTQCESHFDPYLYESFLFYVYRFSNWLIDRQIPLARIGFPFPTPAHVEDYRGMFLSGTYQFDQPEARLVFPLSSIQEIVRQTPTTLRQFLEHSNLAMLRQKQRRQTWAMKVEKLLIKYLAHNPDIDWVAHELGVHPHTLRSRLRKEGTQFNLLRDQLRRDLAYELLRDRHNTIEGVALKLGYSETSSFSRAYKRWTGHSPNSQKSRS